MLLAAQIKLLKRAWIDLNGKELKSKTAVA